MKNVFFSLLFALLFVSSFAQKLNKSDRVTVANLKAHVSYLASDQLEGRRTGTKGEELASKYISEQFQKNGLEPKGENGFFQTFEINEGKQVMPSSFFISASTR